MLPRDDRQLSWESKSAGLDSLLGTIDDVLCLFFVAFAFDVDCEVLVFHLVSLLYVVFSK